MKNVQIEQRAEYYKLLGNFFSSLLFKISVIKIKKI